MLCLYPLTTDPRPHMSLPSFFFFFNDTATTEIYTLSLHDALPILSGVPMVTHDPPPPPAARALPGEGDRKSTRLNSSHEWISYAVFCLKKKNEQQGDTATIVEPPGLEACGRPNGAARL